MALSNTTLPFSEVELFVTLSNHSTACSARNTTAREASGGAHHALQIVVEVMTYIAPIVLTFGIISNILTLMTLQQPKLKESPYIHLTGLTVADLTGLVLIFIDQRHDPLSTAWHYFRIYIYYPLSNVSSTMGVWIMVLMTLERCLFIQFPLWAPIRCTNSSAKLKIVLVFLASCIVNLPRFFWFKIVPVECYTELMNSTVPATHKIEDYLGSTQLGSIITWVHSVLLSFLPVILLVVFNSFLIYKVRSQHKRRDELGIHTRIQTVWTREQTRLTVTLIAIVGFFTVAVLPSAFAHASIAIHIFKDHNSMKLFQHVANFLIWLNFSVNFLMYTFINTKFKRAFIRMLRHWRRRFYLDRLCCCCCCCCGRRRRSGSDIRRQSMFPMVETEEKIPFNNNMNSLQQFDDKSASLTTSLPLNN